MNANSLTWSPLETLYVGGGTPSLWGKQGAEFLKAFLKEREIKISDDCEATLEVNPGTWTEEGIEAFQAVGFNRFSVGVQSTKDSFLEKLDRVHRHDEVAETLSMLQRKKLNFSVDFMLGLPDSEKGERKILEELEEILSYGPSHLSLYILTVKDNYTHYEKLPNDEWIEREFLEVSNYLTERGFEHYEVSNFSKAGLKSKHNSRYWSGESIAALGPSATGYFSNSKIRFKWKTLEPTFQVEELSDSEVRMENFYLKLRTSSGVDLNSFFEGEELKTAKSLGRSWEERGLCHSHDGSLVLTPRGYLLMDSLMNEAFGQLKTL